MKDSILVVEDDQNVRDSILEILSSSGYEVMQAENGRSAVDIASNNFPDLVISDIMMPVMDGYALFERFQEDPILECIPFIFLSAKSTETDIRKGMNIGVEDYLTKPFRAKDLISTVQTRLKKKKKWQNNFSKIRESFALAVPHELRTPLVPIVGFSDLIIENIDNLNRTDILEMAGLIKAGAIRLHSRIEQFILFSSANGELNNMEVVKALKNETVSISPDNIANIVNEKAIAHDRHSDIKFVLDFDRECLKISENYFSIIMGELAENACKFSSPETPIIIRTNIDDKYFQFSVENNGPGFTKDQINNINIFQKFLNESPFKPGSGLGLYMLKEILKVFGGNIEIKSEVENFTRVSVQIPVANMSPNNILKQ